MQFFKYLLVSIGLGCYAVLSFGNTLPTACHQQLSPALCAKIGQMLILGFGGLKQDKNGKIIWQDPNGAYFTENSNIARDIRNQHIGGVILYTHPYRNPKTGEFIRDHNIQNPQQVAKLTQALQAYSVKAQKQDGLPTLPLLVATDQEGGLAERLPSDLGFSHKLLLPQSLGLNEEVALSDAKQKKQALETTRQYADKIAAELVKAHFNTNFAPVVDVNINPLNPIIGGKGRSFSANPYVAADQASQFIQAFHNKNILATLKHFPGHGSSSKDSHEGLVDVTDTYQQDKELLPYEILIHNGYQDLIMTTHVINGQIDRSQCKQGPKDDHTTWCPGTMSYKTLTTLLRKQLGFKGVIVSDDMTMGAIVKEYPLEIALEKAINAGVDMFIIANDSADNTELVVNTIAKLVKEGKVSEAQINRAYDHISSLKMRLN